MNIVCDNVGKRFGREWIFRNFDFSFDTNKIYAITGPNGSGKSTLLKSLATFESYHKGSISYSSESGDTMDKDLVLYQSAFVAPYQMLIEELSLKEMILFHEKMLGSSIDKSFIDELGLRNSMHKEINNFSSGMKQRLKLGLAFNSNRPLIFLDEPTMNLDAKGVLWYQELLKKYKGSHTIFIASNDPFEYEMADDVISIMEYKSKN